MTIAIRYMQLRFARPSPSNTRKYLGFSNQWGAFVIGYHCSDQGLSAHSESIITDEGIEAEIDRAEWMDKRQKGRMIRKVRKIRRFLVPA